MPENVEKSQQANHAGPSEPLVLTVPEACRLARVGRNVGYEMCNTGVWPCLRFGGRILIPRAKFLRFLAEGNLDSAA